jgi:hypothetical protein
MKTDLFFYLYIYIFILGERPCECFLLDTNHKSLSIREFHTPRK